MIRYLLDTNVLSELVRAKPDPLATRWFTRHGGHSATAAPVIQELRYGASSLPPSKRRDRLERYIEDVIIATYTIFPYDVQAADWHGRERARLALAGRPPPFADGFIAAIAAVNDLTLVTANLKDFHYYNELRVESWKK